MSADRRPVLDTSHPLHSLLSGFSEPRDDVLADDGPGGGDATVEPGPPRPPSAGRPLDDDPLDDVPFTPPVPTAALHQRVADDTPGAAPRRASLPSRFARATAVVSGLRPPRMSPKVAALVAAGILAAAVATGGDQQAGPREAPQPSIGGRDRTAGPGHRRSAPSRRARPRKAPAPAVVRRPRIAPSAAPRRRRPPVRATPPAVRVNATASPAVPPPPPTGSHFTSEFTP